MIYFHFKMFVMSLFYFSLLNTDSVTGVRMCGKRLADLLHHMCKQYGGFHTPGDKRNVGIVSEDRREVKGESGIVNECCRNQCTVTTLISYCARGHPTGDLPLLDEIWRLDSEGNPSEKETEYNVDEHFVTTTADPLRVDTVDSLDVPRPNIGVSTRDRPVFIVLTQESNDISVEENMETTI